MPYEVMTLLHVDLLLFLFLHFFFIRKADKFDPDVVLRIIK